MDRDSSVDDDAIVPRRSNASELGIDELSANDGGIKLPQPSPIAQRVHFSIATVLACGSGLVVGRVVSLQHECIWMSSAGTVHPVHCPNTNCALGDTIEVLVHAVAPCNIILHPLGSGDRLLLAYHGRIVPSHWSSPYVTLDWEGACSVPVGCLSSFTRRQRLVLTAIGAPSGHSVAVRDTCNCIATLCGLSAPVGTHLYAYNLELRASSLNVTPTTVLEVILPNDLLRRF